MKSPREISRISRLSVESYGNIISISLSSLDSRRARFARPSEIILAQIAASCLSRIIGGCKSAFTAATNSQTRQAGIAGAGERAVTRGVREVINGLTRRVTIQLQSGDVDFPWN